MSGLGTRVAMGRSRVRIKSSVQILMLGIVGQFGSRRGGMTRSCVHIPTPFTLIILYSGNVILRTECVNLSGLLLHVTLRCNQIEIKVDYLDKHVMSPQGICSCKT